MPNVNRSASAATKTTNRVAAIMIHLPRYAFRGTSRLAQDAGLAKSTISHLVRGQTNPLYSTVERVVKCLSHHLGRRLDHAEVISSTGTYPTTFVCPLVNCSGCLPDRAYDETGDLRADWADVESGHWTGDLTERNPNNTNLAKGGS